MDVRNPVATPMRTLRPDHMDVWGVEELSVSRWMTLARVVSGSCYSNIAHSPGTATDIPSDIRPEAVREAAHQGGYKQLVWRMGMCGEWDKGI